MMITDTTLQTLAASKFIIFALAASQRKGRLIASAAIYHIFIISFNGKHHTGFNLSLFDSLRCPIN